MTTNLSLSAVVVGATGAVGTSLVEQLLKDPNFHKITTIGRRKFENCSFENDSKLNQIVVDMDNMKAAKDQIGECDVAFSCLGTTKADAGSAEAFRHIDYDLVVDFANLTKEIGVKCFNLVSSQMANPNSWLLYMKTKGQAEEKLKELEFQRLNIFKPGLLDRKDKTRFNEKLAKWFVPSISVDTVAKAMIALTVSQFNEKDSKNVNVLSNSEMKKLAAN